MTAALAVLTPVFGSIGLRVLYCNDMRDSPNANQELTYRELAEAMPQQVWTATPDGSLDYVNLQVVEYCQTHEEDLLGAGWLRIVHPDDIPPAVARWVHSLQSGDPYEVEFRLLRAADSMYRWHLGRAVPRRAEGQIVKWLGTNTDTHDRKQVETELSQAKAAADSANQAKSAFLANMSHELRTPLNAIIGYSEIVMEEAHDAGQSAFVKDVEKIRSAGKHLLELINAVLDFSKIDAGKMELCLERFSVQKLVEEVVSVIRPLADRNRNTLRIQIADNVDSMFSDPTKLRQSLLNLLGNACKFTDRGHVAVVVARVEPDTISFAISDTGIGMRPDQVEKLFEPFTQANQAISRNFGGTGLGLVITKRLAHLMGGDVTVRTEEGNGSTFTLSLRTEMASD